MYNVIRNFLHSEQLQYTPQDILSTFLCLCMYSFENLEFTPEGEVKLMVVSRLVHLVILLLSEDCYRWFQEESVFCLHE